MNQSDLKRNSYMLRGSLSKRGYMRWWHSFSGVSAESGETRTFFVEFFLINPGLDRGKAVLGLHPYYRRRGIKPSYVMIKAGVYPGDDGQPGRQLHAFYSASALNATKCPLIMQVGDCTYREDRITGRVEVTEQEARHRCMMSDAGTMEWDLEVYKAVSCHTGFLAGRLSRFLNALDSYWHGEGIRSFFRGTVTLDGEQYIVNADTSYGYADKHWGRSFNRPWMQFACCSLTSRRTGRELRHSALAVNGCCPRFLFIPLRRRLMIQLSYTGESIDFGFGRNFPFGKCRWETKETGKRFVWHIMARNRQYMIKISGSCTKEKMLKLKYENPDGGRSRTPLQSGGSGIGTVEIYRIVKGERELLDTLDMTNALCIYRAQGKKPHTDRMS